MEEEDDGPLDYDGSEPSRKAGVPSGIETALAAAGERRFLSAADTVQDLLRAHLHDEALRYGRYQDGKLASQQAQGDSAAACLALAQVFMGKAREDEFFAQPWNSPEQLGVWLVETQGLTCRPEEAAQLVLLELSSQWLALIERAAAEAMPDDALAAEANGLVEAFTAVLIGYPGVGDLVPAEAAE